ncbi:mucin-5AC isoform X1 [Bactrocera tryoni]|uniref:mucin-5AC isoform X1 n=1 Tax=Bactrocera tryoni TaxID=59916 RepID=UPI001A95CB7A|nr:mucin-5AC isoform X1 [Bactrocera tryoni]
MAKITRRAVASSSVASTTSTDTSRSSRATSSSTSKASKSTATASATIKTTTNANNIIYGGKPARLAATDMSDKLAMPLTAFNDTPPLRSNGTIPDKQFTTNGHSALPAVTNTTTGTAPVFNGINGRHRIFMGSGRHNKSLAERRIEQEEFYATYDVMTGVRIAATLSGFFGLMVFLIVWKSRSSSNETMKVLKDPKMAAVAAVCMQEEEEREIQEAMVATGMSIYPDEYDAILYRRQRMLSLGNVSAPPMLNRGYRFSSVDIPAFETTGGGGYSSLLEPPRRFSYSATSGVGSFTGGRRKSGSESSRILSNYPMGSSFGNDDYFIETEDELECTDYPRSGTHLDELPDMPQRTDSTKSKRGFLEVPPAGQDSRRSSAMTCCSTESSYLERRCSAFTLGLSNLPPTLQRKLSTASRTSSTDNWDYYYPDIQVIQPTPKPSPCPSERSLYEQLQAHANGASTSSAKVTGKGAEALPDNLPVATITTQSKTGSTNTVVTGDVRGAGTPTDTQKIVRKHSIAYYDPESAQGGRKQEIHSISADTVDIYPYNQTHYETRGTIGSSDAGGTAHKTPLQTAPTTSTQYGFHYSDSPTEDSRGSLRGKVTVVELQRLTYPTEEMTPPPIPEHNNNNFSYSSTAAAIAAAAVVTANSSSISIDSTPISLDRLNGSGSLGTISAKALFNVERRAPLASLSSFKISSLEYQDSEARSVDEDSVFLDSVADTDEDMQQLSSDSDEVSFGEHDPTSMRENVALVVTQDTTGSNNAEATATVHTRPQPLKYPIEKRYSLGAASNAGVAGTKLSRARRPLLQRHRTISVSSSDRVALIGHQLKEFQHTGSGSQTPTTIAETVPLETHFGSIICTSSSPTHLRRAQLLQQYSDPQSLPTTTTTTATTEDDTCSTLNTELCGGNAGAQGPSGSGSGSGGGGGTGGGGGSATLTQNSSLNTVVSFGRSSPLTDNNKTSCSLSAGTSANVHHQLYTTEKQKALKNQTNKTQPQLPCSRLYDDSCASSVSDSLIITSTTRQPIICMPASLKNLILRGSGAGTSSTTIADKTVDSPSLLVSRSATNLSASNINTRDSEDRSCRSVMLELPLIKLPTDESSESSSASEGNAQRAQSKSEGSREPSLTRNSRKWSKETLF